MRGLSLRLGSLTDSLIGGGQHSGGLPGGVVVYAVDAPVGFGNKPLPGQRFAGQSKMNRFPTQKQ